MEGKYKIELLAILKLFERNKVLGFFYEQKNGRWSLFIHLSNGVIQISGDKKHTLKEAVYASPIIDAIPSQRAQGGQSNS